MDITPQHIEAHTEKFKKPAEVLKLAPKEIPLTGFEAGPWAVINTDIPAEDKRAAHLRVLYTDLNPQGTAKKKIDRSKRMTMLIPVNDGNDEDEVGFIFEGFISPLDVRLWYRNKFGYSEEGAASK